MGLITQQATTWVGYVAAFCTTLSLVPQLLRVWRHRSARDLSLPMFLLFSIGVTLWLCYGVSTRSGPVIAANAVTLVLSVTILALKIQFDGRSKNLGDSQ